MRTSALILLSLLAAACNNDKNKDQDGDGYVGEEDCDEGSDAINAGATELCDGIDNNCDGEQDEGLLTAYYADVDLDGYGDPTAQQDACEMPYGYVDNADDCNDADANFKPGATENNCEDPNDYNCDGSTGYADEDLDGWAACEECNDADGEISPDAAEICDDIDNDCDNDIDTDATDAPSWYVDSDGDTYGNPDISFVSCDQPAGTVADNTDCEDLSDEAYPGAPEQCDLVDNDCDLETDESDAIDASTWYADLDADTFGDINTPLLACPDELGAGPAGYVADSTDCDDTSSATFPGAPEQCDELDNDCDVTVDEDLTEVYYLDADADLHGDAGSIFEGCDPPHGYVGTSDDCDDLNADAYPGASEVCDSADNDCDGASDEGLSATWYTDTDSDGYGVAGSTVSSCDPGPGYAEVSGDCDDTASDINPGMSEICDEDDNDCDGGVDEGVTTTYFDDNDGDGYGYAPDFLMACALPDGFVVNSSDCDDTSSQVSPIASEVCDGIDNDCDGAVDDDDATLIGGTETFYADEDSDGFGDEDNTIDACYPPDGYVDDSTDCDDGDLDINPDAVEVCNDSTDNNCDNSEDSCELDLSSGADAAFLGEVANEGGFALGHGDVNGDSVADILLGSIAQNNGGASENDGAAYVFYGPFSGDLNLSDADLTIVGRSGEKDTLGGRVEGLGDWDGDGLDEFAVSATQMDASATLTTSGAVYVFFGSTAEGETDLQSTDADIVYYGASKTAYLGSSLVSYDVNGDGDEDILTGASWAPERSSSTGQQGVVYLLYGGDAAGSYSITSVDEASFQGEAVGDRLGVANTVDILEDVNDDGFADIVLGAHLHNSESGAVYLALGPHSGDVVVSDVDVKLEPGSVGDWAGRAVSSIGDNNGDGYSDFLVSSPRADYGTANSGAVFLIEGSATIASLDGDILDDSAIAWISGGMGADQIGSEVDAHGDEDADGYNDILIGSTSAGSAAEGAAFFFYGPLSGTLTTDAATAIFRGTNASDAAGADVAFVGNADGGIGDRILIDASEDDTIAENAGAAYLVYEFGL